MADAEEEQPTFVLATTPHDKVHYPATNQAHYCWQRYNEYVLCAKKNKGDETTCQKAKQYAKSICPDDWYQTWEEQRVNRNFLGVQEHERKKKAHH